MIFQHLPCRHNISYIQFKSDDAIQHSHNSKDLRDNIGTTCNEILYALSTIYELRLKIDEKYYLSCRYWKFLTRSRIII